MSTIDDYSDIRNQAKVNNKQNDNNEPHLDADATSTVPQPEIQKRNPKRGPGRPKKKILDEKLGNEEFATQIAYLTPSVKRKLQTAKFKIYLETGARYTESAIVGEALDLYFKTHNLL